MTSLTADRSVRATHIVVSRPRFARAVSTRGHNVRLAIWLAGWRIEIYVEVDNLS
jgi:transcription antitermination factor NusA-like protein